MRMPLVTGARTYCGLLALALSFVSARASALTLPGAAGADESGDFCFAYTENGASNLWCDGTNGTPAQPLLSLILPVNPGTHTVTISYYTPTAVTLFPCGLGVADPAWGGFPSSTMFQTSNGFLNSTASLTVTVPTGQLIGVWCNVPHGGTLYGVTYDE